MTETTTTQVPAELSEYDWWELEAFHQKVLREGWRYAEENYGPRFEFAGYEPLDSDTLRGLWRRHRPELERVWAQDGQAACDRHNAHVNEAQRRAEHRALWAVRFANGRVATCPDEAAARFMHGEPTWTVVALLTRDVPGGQWREVEAVPAGVEEGD
ncbi:MAG TPA: hypothetical protein VGW74_04000 [Propionibacteriaceae bacterium]|nr:hypothetical protein [Propionibacteriaceae bacterium]